MVEIKMSNGDVFRVDEELNAVVQRIQGSRRRLETFRTVEPGREICLNPGFSHKRKLRRPECGFLLDDEVEEVTLRSWDRPGGDVLRRPPS